MENVRFGSLLSSFWESLVEDAPFGRLHSPFLGKSRGSFWKSSFSVFGKVSWKTLVLEV